MNEVPNRRQEQVEAFAAGNIAATRHHGGERVEHTDPRERLLMLYGVWVKCLPHQAGRRRLVEQAIQRVKAQIAALLDDKECSGGCGGAPNHPDFDWCSR